MQRFILVILLSLTALHLMAQKRVISLSPSVTYTIQQIGAGNTIVGRTSFCPEIEGSVVVGDVLSTNIEAIIALKPDVVFTMAFTKESIISKLKSLGIEVVNFNTPRSFDEIAITTLKIGKYIGEPAKTQHYLSEELDRIKALKDEIAASEPESLSLLSPNISPKQTALFQIGANPTWAVTPDSYMNEYISIIGLYNIVKSTNGQINREFVMIENPNIIFLSDMGDTGITEAEMAQWNKLIPQAKIIVVDANKSCCPTPQFFRETLEFMYKSIH
ncbi:MAG: ABC transporter substrate-binding protein [Bacteroidales bacterium]|nr:ABC transporter substrate-binding protein [Bacteroidales bacterium]